MSIQAVAWALTAPGVPATGAMTLVGLANHADEKGQAAFPAMPLLARYARKSERQVQRDLRQLEGLGLIARGDQQRATHLPADRRPVVYDLVMQVTDPRGDTHVTPRSARGDTHDTPGVTPMTERGDTHVVHGVTPMSPKPSLNHPLTNAREVRHCDHRSRDYGNEWEWFDHQERCGEHR